MELLPVCTTLLHCAKIAIALQNLVFPLDELNSKTSGDVEWDVTVHLEACISIHHSGLISRGTYQPCTGIVRLEGKHEVSQRG